MSTLEPNSSSLEERFNRYMDNVRKANKKYIDSHREIINEKCRNYYHNNLANNEDYKAKKRAYNKQLYEKKKTMKSAISPDTLGK